MICGREYVKKLDFFISFYYYSCIRIWNHQIVLVRRELRKFLVNLLPKAGSLRDQSRLLKVLSSQFGCSFCRMGKGNSGLAVAE